MLFRSIPGIHCHRVSPELYFGYTRGKLGNEEELRSGQAQEFRKPDVASEDTIYLEGKWTSSAEYMAPALNHSDKLAHIYLRYTSSEVNLVVNPEKEKGFKVLILQDNKYLDPEDAGDDVEFESNGEGYVVISDPKMYNLIRNRTAGSHLLQLSTDSNGFSVYAFTFISCVI